MSHSLNRYLSIILKRRLDVEAQRWIGALDSGFDVAVVSPDRVLLEVVQDYLQASIKRFATTRVPIVDDQKHMESAEPSGPGSVAPAVQQSRGAVSGLNFLHLRTLERDTPQFHLSSRCLRIYFQAHRPWSAKYFRVRNSIDTLMYLTAPKCLYLKSSRTVGSGGFF